MVIVVSVVVVSVSSFSPLLFSFFFAASGAASYKDAIVVVVDAAIIVTNAGKAAFSVTADGDFAVFFVLAHHAVSFVSTPYAVLFALAVTAAPLVIDDFVLTAPAKLDFMKTIERMFKGVFVARVDL